MSRGLPPATGTGHINEARGAFNAEEYTGRMARIRAAMEERDLGALIVTSPENIYYLIGLSHQGYFAFTMLILPYEGTPILLTRGMERHTISQQAPDVFHVGYQEGDDAGQAAVRAVKQAGCEAALIGVDHSSMFFPPGVWRELEQGLPAASWLDTSRSTGTDPSFRTGLIDWIRLVKSPAELRQIRQAAAISDRAARAGMEVAGVGTNEKEVAAAIYRAMILGGGEYPGFVPLVRSTQTLMQEHATWGDRVLMPGDKLFLELSGTSARYHAPLTRMAYMARAPKEARRAYEVALAGLEATRSALRPGGRTGEVYEAWQTVIDEGLGHSSLPRHHCGYAVGIGFPPSWVGSSSVLGIRPGGRVEIKEGMVFHLLSWVTDPDLGDYLVSDTAEVCSGTAELLTSTARTLVVE
ncbi:MAG: Xaa-Pro peptidase family protein [Actinomycetota bacterium]|nr:Xaa-Pro peptidase family protein [Actinomycetota bacterium]